MKALCNTFPSFFPDTFSKENNFKVFVIDFQENIFAENGGKWSIYAEFHLSVPDLYLFMFYRIKVILIFRFQIYFREELW